MEKIVFIDIDEVVLKTNFIFDEIEQKRIPKPRKWLYFNANVHRCTPNDWCVDLVKTLAGTYKIIFLTARSEHIREVTEQTLKSLFDFEFELLMRDVNDDDLSSWYVKEEHLVRIQKENRFCIEFALDDDLKNCLMYKKNGVVALNVM